MLKALNINSVNAVLAEKYNGAHPVAEQRNRPMNHMRIVIAHMLGSSLLDTEALTSGKGLSLSLMTLGLNSILRGEKENGLWGSAAGLT